jgi:hypothetical protein
MPNSSSNLHIQVTSAVAFAKDLYSASMLDLDTVVCLLALQEIKLSPRKTTQHWEENTATTNIRSKLESQNL